MKNSMEIIIDELIRSKRKTVTLSVDKDARLVVRAPLKLSLIEIEKLVNNKKDWITDKKMLVKKRTEQAHSISALDEGILLFLGSSFKVVMDEKSRTIVCEDDKIRIPKKFYNTSGAEERTLEFPAKELCFNSALKKWYRKQADGYLSGRISDISQTVGIPYRALRLSDARKRWGSCNSINNINLAWRLIMAKPDVIDYVIIHELCHVIYKNHSPAFWNKVKEYMPDYAVRRKWLKENNYILDTF